MRKKIIDRLNHAVTAMLLSSGVVMSVLGVMDASFPDPGLLMIIAAVIVAFEALSLHRVSAVCGIGAALAGTLIWAFSPKGTRLLSDITIAVSLRIRGIDTALPLIGAPVKILFAILLTVLCCSACVRKATCLPPLIMCLAAGMLVWLTNRTEMIPWLLPAFIALISILMTSGYGETRIFRTLPWSAGIVLLAFLIAGNGTVLQPLKEKADEMRRSVMDRMFFTEARDVFSLYAVGFSPQGPDQLGGKPNPGDETVMTVSAPKTVYLRGTIYDKYTGHSWQNSAGGKRFIWQSDRMEKEKTDLFDMVLPPESVQNTLSREYTVTVRMESGSTSTLFVPQRIRELTAGSNMVPYFSNSSEIFITRNLKEGDIYTVTALLYTADDPGIGSLVEICGKTAGKSEYNNIPDIYLSLPAGLDPALGTMAADITRDADTPFEKAYRIQQYLMKTYEYSTDVEDQQPENDFVTTFLMGTKKGYCTYFASAMTVLCRLNHLPARYVEGYLAEPDPSEKAVVTGQNAHAWTEVYFEGFGWLTFDATSGRNLRYDDESETDTGTESETPKPDRTPEPTVEPSPEPSAAPSPTPENTPEPSETPQPSPEDQPPQPTPTPPAGEDRTSVPPDLQDEPTPDPEQNPRTAGTEESIRESTPGFPWIVLLAVLILMLAVLRLILTSPSVKTGMTRNEEKKSGIWIQEISDLLTSDHFLRKEGETPLQFAERVDRTGFYSTVLRPVGETISSMVYSRKGANAEGTTLIRDTAVLLKAEISKPAKARYWIRRFFLSAGRRDWRKP